MIVITSLQNPRIKEAARLRDRRHREKRGRIVIDGSRELGRAIDAGLAMLEIYLCPTLATGEDAQRFVDLAAHTTSELIEVSELVFAKLAFGDRADGVLGVAAMPSRRLTDIELPSDALVAVLEGVEKPGNIGAVLRSADAAGLSAVVLCDPRTDLYNPNAIRASLGTIFTLPICVATVPETIAWLQAQHLEVAAARVDGAVPFWEFDYRPPTAIVLGSEAHGLSSAWSLETTTSIALPMLGAADSLNVSATAAVLFYEARRQRTVARGEGRGARG